MPSYKFSYFDLRGRGEPSRMLFAAAGIPFTDKRVTQEEFGKMKATDPYASLPILEVTAGNDAYMMNQSMAINRHLARTFEDPFLSLPILEVSNAGGKGSQETVVMNQSMAINRHLARTFGLDGETLNDKAMVDEIIENLVDLKGAMFPIFFNDNEETRKKFADTQAKMCPKLEAQIQRNMKKGGGFAVGSKMTFADIFIFEAFESILGKDASCLDKYPGIKQCREKTGKHPKIAEYVKKRKETPF
ncbi:hypothetical protein FSP39_005095 [Pinctada imbricata]|uniref:Glutathione S-transferase n=1 Tax=Pinctada imbricata TaxID=66713 RepID=A0AA88XQ59_PINIB|nr:hypothetical protein FSP39_005095 [Pinctada imbricata]